MTSDKLPNNDLKPVQTEIISGPASTHSLIKTLTQLKQQTNILLGGAKKLIQIYSHGLDPRVLNNSELEKHLIHFIRRSRHSRIQILIYDENLLRGIDHRLVSLAQRFTSFIQIKIVPRDFHENPFGFYLVDNHAMIYRTNVERYEAEKSSMPDSKVNNLGKLFDTIWQASSPASFLRALHL